MKRYKRKLKYIESSLSRIVQHIQEHDTGFITAFRSEYTRRENQKRNKILMAKLASLTYGITSVKGAYIENYTKPNAIEVGEQTFFIVDLRDKGNLKKNIIALGKEFEQDSVMYVPKGGAYSLLIGTRENTYPGLGVEKKLPILKFGKDNNEFLTRVGGRPFYFSEQISDIVYCGNNLGLYAASIEAKRK